MALFTQSELTTICCFFGVVHTPDLHELPDFWFLEPGHLEHPSGDRLEVLPAGIICLIENHNTAPEHHFQRNLHGLLAALDYVTTTLQD